MYIKTLLLLVSIFVIVHSMHTLYKREQRQHYCGKNLTQALQIICNSFYNSKRGNKVTQKQRDFEKWITKWTLEDKDWQQEQNFPILIRSDAMNIFNRKSREGRVLVVEECCHKGCTITELKTYCAVKKEC